MTTSLTLALPDQKRAFNPLMEKLEASNYNYIKMDNNGYDMLVDDSNPASSVIINIEKQRPEDIFNDVAAGEIDFAVLGRDKVMEFTCDGRGEVINMGGTGLSECFFYVVANEDTQIQSLQDVSGMRIATSYPEMLRAILDKNSIEADIIMRKGGTERYVARGSADAAFEVVETGSQLRKNNLEKKVAIESSDLLVIARNGLTAEQQSIVMEFRNNVSRDLESKAVINQPNSFPDRAEIYGFNREPVQFARQQR